MIRRHALMKIAVPVILLGVTGIAVSVDLKNHDVKIVVADESDLTRHIVDGLQRSFPSAQVSRSDKSDNVQIPQKRKILYLAVGPSALRNLCSQGIEDPIVSTFTSSQAYHSIMENGCSKRVGPTTAIFADPAPENQLQLISLLFKKQVPVIAILGPKSSYIEPILRRAAAKTKSSLSIGYVVDGQNLDSVLNKLGGAKAILAIPDNTIYNAENIRDILVTTYRRNLAVVGFSANLVKAGALASVKSGIDDIVPQLDEQLADFDATGKIFDPQFPKYFSVIINEDVARSLNIIVDDGARKFGLSPKAKK